MNKEIYNYRYGEDEYNNVVIINEVTNSFNALHSIDEVETQKDFDAWEESESEACRFENEIYLKFNFGKQRGGLTAMTLGEINETLDEMEEAGEEIED